MSRTFYPARFFVVFKPYISQYRKKAERDLVRHFCALMANVWKYRGSYTTSERFIDFGQTYSAKTALSLIEIKLLTKWVEKALCSILSKFGGDV
ncbi:MAG: hypothetical protein ACRECW_02520 [Phyllobacterium sp.]